MRRTIKSKVDRALGCGNSEDRLLRACPACLYSLKGETKLPYSLLAAADGNMSLRRFIRVGTADTAQFNSSYFLPKDEVDKFSGAVQVRKKIAAKGKGKGKSKSAAEGKGKGRAKSAAENAPPAESEDEEDAELEMDENGPKEPEEMNEEGGILPAEKDPLADTFKELPSECAEKWKANADDDKKVMWDVFDECGIFIMVCRHGIVLLACDIVRSGEL